MHFDKSFVAFERTLEGKQALELPPLGGAVVVVAVAEERQTLDYCEMGYCRCDSRWEKQVERVDHTEPVVDNLEVHLWE